MESKNGQAEIVVKLLSSGRYIWSISYTYTRETSDDTAIAKIKSIDGKLKEKFPEFARRGSGRIANLDED